jgi:thymidylate kinase
MVNKNDILKTPFKIHVIWHPDFTEGRQYANAIFSTFSRSPNDYNGENIGIPVNFITNPSIEVTSLFGVAEHTAFVLIVDNNMLPKKDDDPWASFVNDLYSNCDSDRSTIIYPIVLCDTKATESLKHDFDKNNFILLNKSELKGIDKTKVRISVMMFELAHEFCRIIYNRERVANDNLSTPTIKVFISYARKDGANIKDQLNDFISLQTGLKTFVDINDIPKGSEFQQFIDQTIKEGVILLSVYTDAYSSSNACQGEILVAKQNGCPIVLLDALSDGEIRRFPYGANEKAIHLGHEHDDDGLIISEERIRQILATLLLEALKEKYSELFLKYSADLYLIPSSQRYIFNNPPELYTLLMNLNNNGKIVIYPDPPLQNNELAVLKKYKPDKIFSTATSLPLINYDMNAFLTGKNIGLSVSEIVNEGDGARTTTHLLGFYIELCRYLFSTGVNLTYCGLPQYTGINFVETLKELASSYSFGERNCRRINLFHLEDAQITNEVTESLMPYFGFEEVESTSTRQDEKIIENYKNDLSKLRVSAAKAVSAQIVVGGKTQGYKGHYQGVIEEAYISLQNNTPLYILGAYGGCGELLTTILKGESVNDVDETIAIAFKQAGIAGLNNGLTAEENLELFDCSDTARNISLILKGLAKTLAPQATNKSGQLVVFEGINHVGKSTIVEKIFAVLQASGTSCSQYSFPGKTDGTLGKLVYDIHHDTGPICSEQLDPVSLQILHVASHIDILKNHILPDLNAGKIILLDRYWWSTFAYGIGNGLSEEVLNDITLPERKMTQEISSKTIIYITRKDKDLNLNAAKTSTILYEYTKLFNTAECRCILIENDGDIEEAVNQVLEVIQQGIGGINQ